MDLKATAIKAAKEAGKILLKLSEKKIQFEMKGSHDILAQADSASDKKIKSIILENFPDHDIHSEEGDIHNHSDYLWAIDPLDGTIIYSRKIDDYCVSIAVEHKGEIIIGVIYEPYCNHLFVAEKEKGAFMNNKRISVSKEDKMINMLLATDNSTSHMKFRIKNYTILKNICHEVRQIRILGAGAVHMTKVAKGDIDLYFKTKYNHWDYAAGVLLIEEAGGKVTDFEGNKITKESVGIVASNGKVHKEFLDKINK